MRSVVIPARNEAGTIGRVVEACLRAADQVVVVDAASTDRTAELAAPAEVHQEADLLPEFGQVLGKGDAMWRALSVVRGDVVVYVDADSSDFGEHFVHRLAEPIEQGAQFVKGHYRRPFRLGETVAEEGGGRVTELTAKPLLATFYPELSVIQQPLAGEVAATRDLLVRLPFSTGYAVEIAMLIDAWQEVGIDGIAQADLEVRQNRHQALSALRPMADAVLAAVSDRLVREGRLTAEPSGLVERAPLASVTS